ALEGQTEQADRGVEGGPADLLEVEIRTEFRFIDGTAGLGQALPAHGPCPSRPPESLSLRLHPRLPPAGILHSPRPRPGPLSSARRRAGAQTRSSRERTACAVFAIVSSSR